MIISCVCPFIYSFLMGFTWSAAFKKKFADSLAPAFMVHILVILLSGLIFNRLSPGMFGWILIVFILLLGIILKEKMSPERIKNALIQCWKEGLCFFTLFYFFCFISNIGKWFTEWDEFSHWGIFLKETLRLDALYCTSSLPFAHKDYVPAITLFETLWCRLSGRFREADAYRAIQIFMFSMLLPVLERFSEHCEKKSDGNSLKKRSQFLPCSAFLLVMLVPLLFHTYGFRFYHSVYCDVVIGLEFFYCVYETFRDDNVLLYQILVLTIAGTVFVLTKMIALALLTMVFALYISKAVLYNSLNYKQKKNCMLFVLIILVPLGFWLWFNRYVDGYVPNTGNIQSFDGIDIANSLNVFFSPAKSSIPYLIALRDKYVQAIWLNMVLIVKYSSYGLTLLILVFLGFVLSFLQVDPQKKMKTRLVSIWLFMAGAVYALLMYYLYATAFSESEAMDLASFVRYMSSFLIMAIYILLAIYFESGIWKKHQRGYNILLLSVLAALLVFQTDYEQLLPGMFSHDEEMTSDGITNAAQITDYTPEGSRIFFIRRGDDGLFASMQRYYCNPRIVTGSSVGPPTDETDHWSVDLSLEEFVCTLSEYDYLYFDILDEAFLQKYSAVFEDPEQLNNNSIYKITGLNPLITLEGPEE